MESNERKKRKTSKARNPEKSVKGSVKKRKRILVFAVEAVLLLIVCGFLYVNSMWDKINIEPVKPEDLTINSMEPEVEELLKGYLNIAVFGVDARDNKILDKGTHSDVVMICSINRETGDIRLVSVYRDTWLNIKEDKNFNKITQSYFQGGASQAVNTLNKNLDLNIKDYVTVNWKAVADAINLLGGVDVDITKSEFSLINGFITETVKSTGIGSIHLKAAGMNHLDGVQAVAYARLRKLDTDYKRTERQRLILELMMQKAKQADIGTLIQIVNTVFPQVMTSLEQGEVLDLAKNISKYNIAATAGFPFDKQSQGMGSKGDCVIPLGLTQNVKQLHEFLFASETYTPSATVKKIDQMIKENTGLGDPGTTSKANPAATTKAPVTKPPTTEEETSPSESTEETLDESNTIETEETMETSDGEGTSSMGETSATPPSSTNETTAPPVTTEEHIVPVEAPDVQ